MRAGSVVLLVLALVGATLPAGAAPAEGDRVAELERQVAALKAEVAALKAAQATAPGAASGGEAAADRVAEIERRLEVLAAEIERLKVGEAAAEADEPQYGMGPAASKVYRVGRGVSVGGYGEMLYQSFDSRRDDGAASGATDNVDFLRAVLYFGYKFSDRFLLNSELEWEHASTGETGEISVEFAYLDYLWKPEANLRAGLLLLPMGLLNELHEPTIYLGAKRPDVERVILPTTWRENGFGLWGDVGPFTYRTYVVNGLDATGFAAAGLRSGRQKGSQAKAEDFAWVGRLDYVGTFGLLAGASAYVGDSGQGLKSAGREIGVATTIIEGHLDWRFRGFQARALLVKAELDDAAALNAALGLTGNRSVGEELSGYYLEAGYDLLAGRGSSQRQLIPFARFEAFDTQETVPAGFLRDPARDVESLTLGVAFKPIERWVLKLDYQDYDNGAGTGVDQINVALGYVF
jgi:uncharacterized small protein (DUF1192 family)